MPRRDAIAPAADRSASDRAEAAATTFYFVRHGETEYNRKRIIQGRGVNSTLNETGRAQAERLAERLAAVPFAAIYTSTLDRAEETATILAREHPGAPMRHLEDLEEMSWGAFEGEPTTDDVLARFDAVKADWRGGDFDRAVDGGESARDVQQRALRAVETIMADYAGDTVLVVTHGRFLRVLIASLLDEYGLRRMHEVKHSNTAVNRVVCRGGVYEADLLNCTAHLEDVDAAFVE